MEQGDSCVRNTSFGDYKKHRNDRKKRSFLAFLIPYDNSLVESCLLAL